MKIATVNNAVIGNKVKFKYTARHLIALALVIASLVFLMFELTDIFLLGLEPASEENYNIIKTQATQAAITSWILSSAGFALFDRTLWVKLKSWIY